MYLLLADDLTGGNDAGIQFVKHGIAAHLALRATCLPPPCADDTDGQVLAVNTDTRNLPEEAAAKQIAALVASIKNTACPPPAMVFKKIDSTLRGNIGAEIGAIMDGFGFAATFLTPAYPQQGRTVVDGDLLVNGVPVHRTIFANDPVTPVTEASISATITKQLNRKTGFVPLSVLASGAEAVSRHIRDLMQEEGAECIIFDARTTENLVLIAEAGLAMTMRPLFAGSAGLADALAFRLAKNPVKKQSVPSRVERVFFICGSANESTHLQTGVLADKGIPVIRISENFIKNPEVLAAASASVIKALGKGSAVLAAPIKRIGAAGDSAVSSSLNAALASTALDVLRSVPEAPHSTALVMTGGETAYTLLERLGDRLSLHAELLPGIAACAIRGGPWNGLRVVTKAGGFGSPQALLELAGMLLHS